MDWREQVAAMSTEELTALVEQPCLCVSIKFPDVSCREVRPVIRDEIARRAA
jgi:hypothetical protein